MLFLDQDLVSHMVLLISEALPFINTLVKAGFIVAASRGIQLCAAVLIH
jgi:cytoskeletal protein RodZ